MTRRNANVCSRWVLGGVLLAAGALAGCETGAGDGGAATQSNVMASCVVDASQCAEVQFNVRGIVEGEPPIGLNGAVVEMRDSSMRVVATQPTDHQGVAWLLVDPGAYIVTVLFGDCEDIGPNACIKKNFPEEVGPGDNVFEEVDLGFEAMPLCGPDEDWCWELPLDRVIKPNVYLYPEETTEVSVRLDPLGPGDLTVTIPEYDQGWDVVATPDGMLTDLHHGGGEYTYLFYEGDVLPLYQMDEGFSVSYEELEQWMRDVLPRYGLNEREVADFVDYWTVHLPYFPYYLFFPQGNAKCDEIVPIEITPAPDSILRIWFYIVGSYGDFALPEPTIPAFERVGFTVTEWGLMTNEFSFGLE